jgi:hypothetical protein
VGPDGSVIISISNYDTVYILEKTLIHGKIFYYNFVLSSIVVTNIFVCFLIRYLINEYHNNRNISICDYNKLFTTNKYGLFVGSYDSNAYFWGKRKKIAS